MTGEAIRSRTPVPAFLCGFAAAWLVLAAARAQISEVPYMTGCITDNAEILSPEVRTHLTEIIKAHEEASTNQIAILTVPSLEGISLEDFAARVSRSWKLGVKGKDNGVLLLVSPGDRRVRFEVGTGLKAKLSDVSAGRIIRDRMTPPFQQGDYSRGVDAGVHAIIGALEGIEPPEAGFLEGTQAKGESSFKGPDLTIPERILIGSFIFGGIGLFTMIGVMTPGVGWFLYLFLIPFWGAFPMIVVGTRGALILLIAYIVCFPVAKLVLARTDWYRRAQSGCKGKGVAHIGGFTVRTGGSSSSTWHSR